MNSAAVRGRELWATICAMRGHARGVELGPTSVRVVAADFGKPLYLPDQKDFRCEPCGGHFITPGDARGGFN